MSFTNESLTELDVSGLTEQYKDESYYGFGSQRLVELTKAIKKRSTSYIGVVSQLVRPVARYDKLLWVCDENLKCS